MNYVYALTRKAYEWALPSMRSLAEHDPKARVFILAEDDEFPFPLPFKATIINVSGQEYFPKDSVNYGNFFTYINMLKNCYPALLNVKKVIHLDADTIICDDPTPLWKTDVSGKWVAACEEVRSPYKPYGKHYYNMGVALFNLDQMRKDNIVPEMVEYINSVKMKYPDQDTMNWFALKRDKFADLDMRWNECSATQYSDNPGIVHFCGMADWWTRQSMYRKEYLDRYKA